MRRRRNRSAAKRSSPGAPVRASLRGTRDAHAARERLGLDPDGTTVVVMGGSQGARSINEAVAALVTRRTLPPHWQVLHVSGERDYAYMEAEEREPAAGNRIRLVAYLSDPADAYAAADAVVARAGASTLAELAVTGTPSVAGSVSARRRSASAAQRRGVRAGRRGGRACRRAVSTANLLWWTLRDVLEPDHHAAMAAAARSLSPGDAAAAIVARIERAIPARWPRMRKRTGSARDGDDLSSRRRRRDRDERDRAAAARARRSRQRFRRRTYAAGRRARSGRHADHDRSPGPTMSARPRSSSCRRRSRSTTRNLRRR